MARTHVDHIYQLYTAMYCTGDFTNLPTIAGTRGLEQSLISYIMMCFRALLLRFVPALRQKGISKTRQLAPKRSANPSTRALTSHYSTRKHGALHMHRELRIRRGLLTRVVRPTCLTNMPPQQCPIAASTEPPHYPHPHLTR